MPVDMIIGPFCYLISDTYIAHETENVPDNLVPILMEDGTNNILPENAAISLYGTICVDPQEVCCVEPDTFTFINQTRTEIIYGGSLKERHGAYPSVLVYYYQETETSGEIIILGTYTRISMVGNPPTKIIVDHGGPATGIIKIV